jgi:hypothetical protein
VHGTAASWCQWLRTSVANLDKRDSVARKPSNISWLGFTRDQAELLHFLDHLGNNGWARNSQADELMPKVLGNCEETGLTVACVTEAMMSIGYGRHALHQLDRWESKRTTGRFGR